MIDWSGVPDGAGREEQPDAIIVATDGVLPVRLARLPDDPSIEAGLVVLGSYLGERLVARCAVPADAATMIAERGLLREPARLALAARVAPPGLQCRLFALVTLPREEGAGEEAAEPWADSLPGASYERAIAGPGADQTGPGGQAAAILLGQIVRFARDRRHPDSLPDEAIDVLATIVEGRLVEVVDKVLDDLLEP